MPHDKQEQEWLPLFREMLKYIRIKSKEVAADDERGSVFNLWSSQKKALEEIVSGMEDGVRAFLFLKSRQLGMTTLTLALDIFWLAYFPGTLGALVTDNDENRDKFRETIGQYIDSFPKNFFGKKFNTIKDNDSFMSFSNGSRLDFIVAGKNKENWGEGGGYALVHMTEIASYGKAKGIASFRETLAQSNPNRLFIGESTAKGMNHYKRMWEEFKADAFTKKAVFLGWYYNDMNIIRKSDRRFDVFGVAEPDPYEQQLIDEVDRLYGYKVSDEQLAWYRWKHADRSAREEDLHQNQPWSAEQAFVLTGYSYFAMAVLGKEYERCTAIEFAAYKYHMGTDFWAVVCEQINDPNRLREVTLRVWESPVEDAWYVIGCDPAYGRGEFKNRHCLDSATEILTKSGWKRHDQIKVGDDVSCFNTDTGDYVYNPIQEVIIKEHDGLMYHFKNSDGFDTLVTPEHRMISTYYNSKQKVWRPWQIHTAEKTALLTKTQQRVLPFGGAELGKGIEGLSLDMCRALGWIMTDGYCSRNSLIKDPNIIKGGNGKKIRSHIILCQAKSTKKNNIVIWQEMSRVLKRLSKVTETHIPVKGKTGDKVVWRIGAAEVGKFLEWIDEFDIHKIPRNLLENVSKEQAESLLQGLLEGDGGWDKRENKYVKFCPGHSSILADGFQELALKLGISASKVVQKGGVKNGKPTKPQWLVRLSGRPYHCFQAKKHEPEYYKGIVWCVTVPTGAFVARRNGKVFVTGNCISVWRVFANKMVQVAEYADNETGTRQCAWVLAHLAGAYKKCAINVEINGPGGVIITEMENLREKALLDPKFEKIDAADGNKNWDNFLMSAKWYLYRKPDHFSASGVKGVESTAKLKHQMMSQLRDKFVTEQLLIRSKLCIKEMMDVIQDGDTIGAVDPNTDDRVFAMSYAVRAWIDELSMPLLAQGETYEAYLQAEEGEAIDKTSKFMQNVIDNFFKTREEEAENPPLSREKQWMYDRGFL